MTDKLFIPQQDFVQPADRHVQGADKGSNFLLLASAGMGFHRDIIALNGNMPPEYKQLGYFDNSQGKASHFKRLTKPSDQQRVSEYGLAYNAGQTFRFHFL